MEAIIKRLKNDRHGVSNVLVVMLSLALMVIIVSNVVLWSYQMNQFDWERIQEKLEVTSVERSSPWFTSNREYVIENGSCTSGTYRDTWTVDSAYQTFKETAPLYYNSYNPSSYNLLGETQLISGSLNNLRSNDEAYMTFRSYASTISKTDAFIAYRDSTTSSNIPKERTWTGDTASWSSQNEMPNAGSPVRWVRVAYCPLEQRSYEKIVATLSDDGYLDAYVWNGITWVVTYNIGFVGTGVVAYKCFDVTYEKTSGEALLVYAVSNTDPTKDLAYKIWNGSGWSSEYYINDVGHTNDIQYRWVELASNPTSGSNEITMVALDGTNSDANGWVWDGASWGSMRELETTVSTTTRECIAVAYETLSGRAWTAVGSGTTPNTFSIRSQTSGVWNATKENPNIGAAPYWCTLKADPSSNALLLVSVDGSSDLNTVYYSGSGSWMVHTEHDSSVDTPAQRCANFAWEPSGNNGLLVYGTTSGQITYRTYTAPNTWSNPINVSAAGTHRWVQLRTNPRNINEDAKILGAFLDSNYDIGVVKWDGSTFSVSTGAITIDTATYSYECFELEFCYYGIPQEFIAEVEFTGASDTEPWMQLTWTVDSSFTIDNVTVTLQLYDYQTGDYSTSGEGYITYTSSSTPNIDETRTQNVTNPNRFKDASGNWKLRARCIKSTSEQFDWKVDLIELRFESQNTYSLSIIGDFILDISSYPLAYVDSVEVQVGFQASDAFENWFLKAHNWASEQYEDVGSPLTAETEEFKYYNISLPAGVWQNYVNSENGMIKVKFCDANPDVNQTTINIDFFAVRIIFNGTLFKFKNNSASTIHITAIWIINATDHERYDADFFINPGEDAAHMRTDIPLPSGGFTVKVVTERGNIAVISNS